MKIHKVWDTLIDYKKNNNKRRYVQQNFYSKIQGSHMMIRVIGGPC